MINKDICCWCSSLTRSLESSFINSSTTRSTEDMKCDGLCRERALRQQFGPDRAWRVTLPSAAPVSEHVPYVSRR